MSTFILTDSYSIIAFYKCFWGVQWDNVSTISVVILTIVQLVPANSKVIPSRPGHVCPSIPVAVSVASVVKATWTVTPLANLVDVLDLQAVASRLALILTGDPGSVQILAFSISVGSHSVIL